MIMEIQKKLFDKSRLEKMNITINFSLTENKIVNKENNFDSGKRV